MSPLSFILMTHQKRETLHHLIKILCLYRFYIKNVRQEVVFWLGVTYDNIKTARTGCFYMKDIIFCFLYLFTNTMYSPCFIVCGIMASSSVK